MTTPVEPSNTRELFERAQADLKAAWSAAAELRWCFWHARGVGRLEVARYALKRLELQDAEAWTRSLSMAHIASIAVAYLEARPSVELNTAAEMVIEAAAYVQAAASVMDMMKARRP